ncbi:titin-like, partial [Elysia marginata]
KPQEERVQEIASGVMPQIGTHGDTDYVDLSVPGKFEKPVQLPQPTEDTSEEFTILTSPEEEEDITAVDIDIDIKQDEPRATEDVEFSLSEQEAPRFTQTLQREMVVYEGHSIDLVCVVVGKPVPTVTWYKEEEDITTSERYVSTYENGQCKLTINNITVEEEAEFICKAVNEAGSVTTFVDIFVEKNGSSSRMLVREEFYRMDIELEIHWRRRKPLETTSPRDNHVVCPAMPETHSTSGGKEGELGNVCSEIETNAGPFIGETLTALDNSAKLHSHGRAAEPSIMSSSSLVSQQPVRTVLDNLRRSPCVLPFKMPEKNIHVSPPEKPESPTPEVVKQPETAVEEKQQEPTEEEITQPQESLDEDITVSLIPSTEEEEQQPSSEAVTTETILVLDQPISIPETEEASAAPEISLVEETAEIVPSEIEPSEVAPSEIVPSEIEPSEISPKEQPEEETKQEVDLVQAPEDTVISVSAFESLIDEIDERVSEDITIEVLEKPEEAPIESIEQTFEFVEAEGQKPVFLQPLQNIEAVEGQQVRFETVVSGEPAPEVVWSLDGEIIRDSPVYRIESGPDGQCTLLLPESFPEDEGQYECCATNIHGTASTKADLYVQDLDISTQEVKQATTPEDCLVKASSPLPIDLSTNTPYQQKPLSKQPLSPEDDTFNDLAPIPSTNIETDEGNLITPSPNLGEEVSDDFEELEMVSERDDSTEELSVPEKPRTVSENVSHPILDKSKINDLTPNNITDDSETRSASLPQLSDSTDLDKVETTQDLTKDEPSTQELCESKPGDADDGADVSLQDGPNFRSLSGTMSESTSTFSMSTIAEVSEEDSISLSETSTRPTLSRDDVDALPTETDSDSLPKQGEETSEKPSTVLTHGRTKEHPDYKTVLTSYDKENDEVEDDIAETPGSHEQHPTGEVDSLSTKSPSLVSISDRTSLYGSTVSITTTDDVYTDDDIESSRQGSVLSSIEELAQPCSGPQDAAKIFSKLAVPLDIENNPAIVLEPESNQPSPHTSEIIPEMEGIEHVVDNSELLAPNLADTPKYKRAQDAQPFDIPSISVTDDTSEEVDYQDHSTAADKKPRDKLQNAKSLLSSLVSIDVNVNEGRADKIIRRLSKTPEMISVTRTLRESSLVPDQDDVWSSRRSSFYGEFDEIGPIVEHIPSPEMLRSRRPSLRRDSETVIKETVVSTPAVEVRAEETAYSDHESDSDSDLEEGDDTIMQINISFEGLRQRITSEKASRSEERRRSVSSMLDFSSQPEDVFQRSLSEPFSRRSSTTPVSDRLDSVEESVDLSGSFGPDDFQIPQVNVETEVEDTTDENIQETVLEVADKVFVTVRSEKLTNTVSDISIKIAARDLAPGLFQGGNFLGLPTFTPASETKRGPQEAKDEPHGATKEPQEAKEKHLEAQKEPQEAKDEPLEAQNEPQEAIEEPKKIKKEIQETKDEPQKASKEPQEAKDEPHETKNETMETKEELHEIKNEPQEAKEEPQETTKEPQGAKDEPQETKREIQEAKEEPQETTKEPQEAKDEPQQATKEPQEAKDEPQETTKEPQEAKDEPQDTTKEPQETKKEPQETKREIQEGEDEPTGVKKEPQEVEDESQKVKDEPLVSTATTSDTTTFALPETETFDTQKAISESDSLKGLTILAGENESTQIDFKDDKKATLDIEKEDSPSIISENIREEEEVTPRNDDKAESQQPTQEVKETSNSVASKQKETEVNVEAPDSKEQYSDLYTDSIDLAKANLSQPQSSDNTHNTYQHEESQLSITPVTQNIAQLDETDNTITFDQPGEKDNIDTSLLCEEEESFFDRGRTEVLAEKEESLSEKEKLVTAEIEKEEMSDEEKKELSPIPVEQPVVEEVQDERFAPVVKRTLQDINSHDGGQVRLEAEIEGLPSPTITWFKDGQVLHPSEEFDIAYSEEKVASLYIHDVLPEDAGTYVVQGINELGTVTSEATLHVDAAEVSDVSVEEISGLAPTFTVKPAFQTVDENETVTFTAVVEAVPQPEILWTKDNNPIPEDDTRFVTSVTKDDTFYTTTMEVKEATLQDAGTYKVTASNDLGDTSVTVSLIVNKTEEEKTDFRDQLSTTEFEIPDRPEEVEQKDFREVLQTEVKFAADVDAEAGVTEEAPEAEQVDFRDVLRGPHSAPEQQVEDIKEAPEFIQPIQDVEVREGEAATFECQVKGEPQPQVMWYHDQKPIKSDSVYQISPGEDGKFTLFISEVFPEDSGVYTARAFNDVSEMESSATLTVTGKNKMLP